ncbi:MAG TPA: hypothetical protein VE033_02945, partial [Acetobacteraceae bacterium]|nr:hypothetical protein [Acetobacteraceae bacterium]
MTAEPGLAAPPVSSATPGTMPVDAAPATKDDAARTATAQKETAPAAAELLAAALPGAKEATPPRAEAPARRAAAGTPT